MMAVLSLLPLAGGSGDYYPLSEGCAWEYDAVVVQGRRETRMAARVRVAGVKKVGETECTVLETTFGGASSLEYVAASPAGVWVYGGRNGGVDYSFDAPVLRLKYPPAAGCAWEGGAGRDGTSVAYRAKVLGEESVDVPAGRYDAFKVSMEMDTPAGAVRSFCWYARDVGLVKQWLRRTNALSDMELTVCLKSFSAGGPAGREK